MAKTKNDPRHYTKRTDLIPRRTTEAKNVSDTCVEKRDPYLVAPIDTRFYIDFRPARSGQQK
jgi:hypothetical protein